MDELWLADQGDGTYQNPILFCDYSDPDAIRVGDTYYMTASSFNYVPGLPILVSEDLINWKLANYALKNIPGERFDVPCHAQGVFAPSIRYHEGRFYIYYGMPDEGIYMVSTEDPLGEWDEPVMVLPGKGLIDPCPFWDDDGKAYVIHAYAKSRIGFNSWLGIFPISWDGTRALGEDKLFFDGTANHPTIEGAKVHKMNGWYYVFAPAGGVSTGWQVVLRSRNIYGPYEDRVVLKQGSSEINGPHQGAWIDTPAGEHWFMHFQSRGLYGRITHLQPMEWQEDGWPRIGVTDYMPVDPADMEAAPGAEKAALKAHATDCGIPVYAWEKPVAPECERCSEQGSDVFEGPLGLQWQFAGNWRPEFYEVGGGRLKLFAHELPCGGNKLWDCPQVLTQKIACPAFFAETAVDISGLHEGEQAGFALLGGQYAYAALRKECDAIKLVYVSSDGNEHTETVHQELYPDQPKVYFRLTLLPTDYAEAAVTFEYSLNGAAWKPMGKPFSPSRHTWVGARLALFAMPMNGGKNQGGYAAFDAFRVTPVETFI